LILTQRGGARIEDLAIGDMVVTISGEAKPIKWIGRRSYAGQFITGNPAVLPIVVRAGALAPDIPVRDLWVSPRHALLLDGVFVPAELLVNAQTVVQAEAVDQVDYFHLEFEAHEVIMAEGTPAESYVEYDNRHGFHNAHEFAALYPDDTRPSFGYCLPLAEPEMPELTVIRARLFERAAFRESGRLDESEEVLGRAFLRVAPRWRRIAGGLPMPGATGNRRSSAGSC
jgi:hypothetical protein